MQFDFATAGRIVFGAGAAARVGQIASEFGSRAFVVIRRRAGFDPLENAGIECVRYAVSGEPTVDDVREGAKAARSAECHVVIAVGGGSVIDTAKAIAALAGGILWPRTSCRRSCPPPGRPIAQARR